MIVSNTSPILNLACINKLDILKNLYGQIFIPEAVFNELTYNKNDSISKQIIESSWIINKKISNPTLANSLLLELDKGESEAISLAIELNSTYLLIDETIGRYAALKLNVRHIGLLGILTKAKNKKIITSVKPIIDDLINIAGFWINKNLYENILKMVSE